MQSLFHCNLLFKIFVVEPIMLKSHQWSKEKNYWKISPPFISIIYAHIMKTEKLCSQEVYVFL